MLMTPSKESKESNLNIFNQNMFLLSFPLLTHTREGQKRDENLILFPLRICSRIQLGNVWKDDEDEKTLVAYKSMGS